MLSVGLSPPLSPSVIPLDIVRYLVDPCPDQTGFRQLFLLFYQKVLRGLLYMTTY